MEKPEQSRMEAQWNREDSDRLVEAFGLVQDVLMDEDTDVERPDIWTVSWDELQMAGVEGREHDRRCAYAQIHDLYMHSLEDMYPELSSVDSGEELMAYMAAIPDLPPCDGSFAVSYYRAESGSMRLMSMTNVNMGGAGTALKIHVSGYQGLTLNR